MRFLKFILILTVFILSGLEGFSQTNTITLQSAISNAVKTNISVKKIQNNIDIQEGNIRVKYGGLFPTLSLNGGWTRTNSAFSNQTQTVFDPITGTNRTVTGSANQTNFNYSLSLRSDVTLFNGFSNYENVDIAKMTQTYNYILLEKTRQDVTLKVLSDYVTVLKNQQIVKINESSLTDAQAQLEKIKLFVEAGKKTKADVYNQDVQVAQKELALEQSKNNLDKSVVDLVFDANLSQDRQYTVSQTEFTTELSLESINAYVAQNSNSEPLINTAVRNRNDYKSTRESITISESNLELTRNALLFPTISGYSAYGLSAPKIGDITNSKVFTIGINISYPIFQGFSLNVQRQQAQINLKSANEDLEQLRNQISTEIKKAVLDLKSLNKQIEITDRNLKAAEQNRILAEESYRVGIGTLLDVQTALTNYNNALIDRINLVYNFQLAQKQLEYYQGLLKY
jgi:outer membrane protein